MMIFSFFMENVILDIEVLYDEVKERALAEGAFGREEWNDIIDLLLDEKRVEANEHEDIDWVDIQEALQARYKDFAGEIPEV